jgi:hypothetical protein
MATIRTNLSIGNIPKVRPHDQFAAERILDDWSDPMTADWVVSSWSGVRMGFDYLPLQLIGVSATPPIIPHGC